MAKSHLRTCYEKTSMVVDSQTGELLEQDVKTIKYLAGNREEFFLMYSSLVGLLEKMTSPEIKVYCYLIKNYQIGSPIAITLGIREVIGEAQKLKSGTVNNAISGLSKKGLIFQLQKGLYKLNPRHAFKGSTLERNAMLKFILEVECPSC